MNGTNVKNNPVILPDGRCSICHVMLRVEEKGWIIVKSRLMKINSQERIVKIKCPNCKQFLAFNTD
jgi:hypothetical protein